MATAAAITRYEQLVREWSNRLPSCSAQQVATVVKHREPEAYADYLQATNGKTAEPAVCDTPSTSKGTNDMRTIKSRDAASQGAIDHFDSLVRECMARNPQMLRQHAIAAVARRYPQSYAAFTKATNPANPLL